MTGNEPANWTQSIPLIGRLLQSRANKQLDELRRNNAELAQSLASLRTDRELGMSLASGRQYWMRHHPYVVTSQTAGFSVGGAAPSQALVARILAAFRRVDAWGSYGPGSLWLPIAQDKQREIIEVLSRGDLAAVTALLEKPGDNHLFYGFEDVYLGRRVWYEQTPGAAQGFADRCQDLLVRLAEAMGLLKIENPEGGPRWGKNLDIAPDDVMDSIAAALGIDIAPPRVFGDACGLQTRRGVVTERLINGLYGAWRAWQLVHDQPDARVLEIGAGVGWLAYYAHKLGLRDYTIVDLPLTNVSQAHFLGTALGADNIALAGEAAKPQQIKIGTAGSVLDANDRYTLIVNMDSLTEIGRKEAARYVSSLGPRCDYFLSLNHEANPYSVRDILLAGRKPRRIHRHPYWLRNGYVEELVELGGHESS